MFLQTFRADSSARMHRLRSKGTHLIDFIQLYASPCTIFASCPDALRALRSCDPRSDAKKGTTISAYPFIRTLTNTSVSRKSKATHIASSNVLMPQKEHKPETK